MLISERALRTRIVLLASLLVGGFVLTHSTRTGAQDADRAQATATPGASKQGAPGAEAKVSPYTKANRERAQADAANGTKSPHSAARRGRAGKSGGARQG